MQRVSIERHRPERGSRDAAVAPAGQCCCCCCCCLHSLGGAIGAVTARTQPPKDTPLPTAAIDGATYEPKYSAAGLYWTVVFAICAFAAAWNLGIERHPDNAEALLIIALLLPFVQLSASLVTALIIAFSRRPGKDVRFRHLGRITARAFLGAMIGLVVMLPLLGFLK